MKPISKEIQDASIKSLESTLNKLSNAYNTMTAKGSNTVLVKKRRESVRVGLESLKNAWNGEVFSCDEDKLKTSKEILQGLIPSISKQIAQAKEGSPQKTVNERRLTALELAIESLEERIRV